MSETAATPETAPAWSDPTDRIASILDREAGPEADTDAAAAPPRQPASEAPTEAPDAGGEQSQDADPDQQEQEPPRYRVKVRGQEVEVPLPELLNGYSRNEDYKAKTAEIAEQRRALESERAAVTARAQQLDAMLSQADFDPVLTEARTLDWTKLAQENPAEYVAKRAALEQRVTRYQAAQAERSRVAEEQHRRRLADADAALSAAVPEWADSGKRPAFQQQVARALNAYGFTPQELDGLADHRMLLVARDAMRWRAAEAARADAAGRRTATAADGAQPPAPRAALRPGAAEGRSSRAPEGQKMLQRARASGSTDDIVSAVLANL